VERKNKMKEFKINERVAELINNHGYKSEIIGDEIVPEFKEKVTLETWVYPKEKEALYVPSSCRFNRIGV